MTVGNSVAQYRRLMGQLSPHFSSPTSTAMLVWLQELDLISTPSDSAVTHKMMGPSSGTFSAPITSIERKNEHIAELASATSGLWVTPNGILGRNELMRVNDAG